MDVDLIHVHHLDPLANANGDRPVDAVKHFRPVCPSCHCVIHSARPDPYTINQVGRCVAWTGGHSRNEVWAASGCERRAQDKCRPCY